MKLRFLSVSLLLLASSLPLIHAKPQLPETETPSVNTKAEKHAKAAQNIANRHSKIGEKRASKVLEKLKANDAQREQLHHPLSRYYAKRSLTIEKMKRLDKSEHGKHKRELRTIESKFRAILEQSLDEKQLKTWDKITKNDAFTLDLALTPKTNDGGGAGGGGGGGDSGGGDGGGE